MNLKSKKLLSLFLVFSLMALSGNLFAKKRGAELLIQKKNGKFLRGELIAVKEHSLLLLLAVRDVSVDIGDIRVIRMGKKSKIGKGALNGLLIGVGVGALLGGIAYSGLSAEEGGGIIAGMFYGTILLAPAGALIGAIIGATRGTGRKTIHFVGMTDSEIQEALDYLRKKARIRDYK